VLDPSNWHARFSQQAAWTSELRHFLYQQLHFEHARTVLEVGCGTGAVLKDLDNQLQTTKIYGLDLNEPFLTLARTQAASVLLTSGDALALPYADHSFDIGLCHFFLLWAGQPLKALQEMRRVTRPGGLVCAMAEPDYGGRIDYPEALIELGQMQTQSLQRQGADPFLGRRLPELFIQSGLQNVQSGLLGGYWNGLFDEEKLTSEWAVFRHDLQDVISEQALSGLQALDTRAWQEGKRVLFVPTFYAWGQVP
jgi:ubiquinone/menaquinone biosynthesis C-methylase UbiE